MKVRIHKATWCLAALILAVNVSLLWGRHCEPFVFRCDDVVRGEWWRIVTHPIVHVSGYHLLLDGAAFLFLLQALLDEHARHAGWAILAGGAGSLLGALVAAPAIQQTGLCGLSGIAHGLAVLACIWRLEAAQRRGKEDWLTLLVCAGIVLKAAWEAATGTVAFSSLHFGSLGIPVAACHAGGVLGALAVAATADIGMSRDKRAPAPGVAAPGHSAGRRGPAPPVPRPCASASVRAALHRSLREARPVPTTETTPCLHDVIPLSFTRQSTRGTSRIE
jgi:rhomboid family GlyGly-CTERM serine protease